MRNSDCPVTELVEMTPIYNNPPRAEWPKLTARAAESDSDIESSVRTTLEYVRTKVIKHFLILSRAMTERLSYLPKP